MSSNVPPSEVAEDYKSSLEDLAFNSRLEISNLTVIAKENIHAAQAIARVIEEHIDKTAPSRKLPALYLLDSIVKNVGTPYTLFFGRNLYRTFMDAYTLVDQPIRKKLEEMLQTWKQPVPGSPSSAPVFPSEITRKIEATLIKARTAAVQAQQIQMKQQQDRMNFNRLPTHPQPPYRTPPQPAPASLAYPQTPQQGFDFGRNGTEAFSRNTPMIPQPSSVHNIYNQPPHGLNLQPQPQPLAGLPIMAGSPTSVETLHSDITSLIETAKKRFAENPFDEEGQKRLKALLDLQSIIQTQQLPPAQLAMVKDQLYKLANPSPPPPPPPPPAPIPQLPVPVPAPLQAPNLAQLLAGSLSQFAPAPTPPPPAVPIPQISQVTIPQPTPPAQVPAISDAASLFASLQSAGLLPGLPSLSVHPPPPPPVIPQAPFLRGLIPTPTVSTPPPVAATASPASNWKSIDVELKTASLKIPRPHLISLLYEAYPNQCSSCARRFADNEQGRAEKASHLDWHFRVHQRMAESIKRAQNRSWYVGEEDWIKSTDELDTTIESGIGVSMQRSSTSNNSNISTGTSAEIAEQRKKAAKEQYVPVPNDPTSSNLTCPVCKEKFETTWHSDAEEWVWMDAMKVGQKVYHASCYSESGPGKGGESKSSATTALPIGTSGSTSRGGTPDLNFGDIAAILKSVKRKAEELNIQDSVENPNTRVKVKREA
ncbi:hypothetical protein BDZ91DRAFT_108225 [Kalaharituber pfeilii]|nr:hypothetical protein BDZ91DRAFT_108225 [Kalaharituber pfeilii]